MVFEIEIVRETDEKWGLSFEPKTGLVHAVRPDGPASRAQGRTGVAKGRGGVYPGDRLLAVNGVTLEEPGEVEKELEQATRVLLELGRDLGGEIDEYEVEPEEIFSEADGTMPVRYIAEMRRTSRGERWGLALDVRTGLVGGPPSGPPEGTALHTWNAGVDASRRVHPSDRVLAINREPMLLDEMNAGWRRTLQEALFVEVLLERPYRQFFVELDRVSVEQRWGLAIDVNTGVVEEAQPNTVLHMWNIAQMGGSREVRPGDRVLTVNGEPMDSAEDALWRRHMQDALRIEVQLERAQGPTI